MYDILHLLRHLGKKQTQWLKLPLAKVMREWNKLRIITLMPGVNNQTVIDHARNTVARQ